MGHAFGGKELGLVVARNHGMCFLKMIRCKTSLLIFSRALISSIRAWYMASHASTSRGNASLIALKDSSRDSRSRLIREVLRDQPVCLCWAHGIVQCLPRVL